MKLTFELLLQRRNQVSWSIANNFWSLEFMSKKHLLLLSRLIQPRNDRIHDEIPTSISRLHYESLQPQLHLKIN
jgi:hypothetical protein